MNFSPAIKEFFHNVWFFLKTNFMLTSFGMLIAGVVCVLIPPLIPGVLFAGWAAGMGAGVTATLLTIPLQEGAVLVGVVAGLGTAAGITALAATAAAPFLIPFFACLGIALPIATFISGIAMLSHAKTRRQAAAAAQADDSNNNELEANVVLQPAPAPSSSAQVSQALNIPVVMSGNNANVAASEAPQQQRLDAIVEKTGEKVHRDEHESVFHFQAMS